MICEANQAEIEKYFTCARKGILSYAVKKKLLKHLANTLLAK